MKAIITGDKSDYEKFEKWAETVPYTLRNPFIIGRILNYKDILTCMNY